jgi:hypothetical protein
MSNASYSSFEDATVTGASSVAKSTLSQGVKVNGASSVSESKLSQNVTVDGASSVSETTLLEGVEVNGASHVNKSTLQCATVKRSKVNNSTAMRSVLKGCNVEHCEVEGCTFASRELRYGVWRDGNLVGKTRQDMEPVNRECNSSAGISTCVVNGNLVVTNGGFGVISIGNTSTGRSGNVVQPSGIDTISVPPRFQLCVGIDASTRRKRLTISYCHQ